MSIKKRYFKTKPHCTVTFRLDRQAAGRADRAAVLGEFNDWQPSPMRKLSDGSFTANLDLEPGQAYEFRYLLDDSDWLNEPQAEGFVPTPYFDAENSVIRV